MITQIEAIEAYKKYGSKRAASKALGVPRSTFRRKLGNHTEIPPTVEPEHIGKSFKKDTAEITTKSYKIKTLEDAETRLVNSLASKSIVLRETESSIDAINDKLSKVDADLLTKHDELKKVSENLDQSNAQIIANQKRSSYLADWANQLEIEKKANSNTNKKLRKREKALREANA